MMLNNSLVRSESGGRPAFIYGGFVREGEAYTHTG